MARHEHRFSKPLTAAPFTQAASRGWWAVTGTETVPFSEGPILSFSTCKTAESERFAIHGAVKDEVTSCVDDMLFKRKSFLCPEKRGGKAEERNVISQMAAREPQGEVSK